MALIFVGQGCSVNAQEAGSSSSTTPAGSATKNGKTATATNTTPEIDFSAAGFSKEKPEAGPAVAIDGGFMVPYTVTIPGSEVTFEMIPVPGGEFLMGSPEGEEGHRKDEGPQVKVTVDPFWMGKYEVTWGEYKRYMQLDGVFKEFKRRELRMVEDCLLYTSPSPRDS